jgi:hypothetical protein
MVRGDNIICGTSTTGTGTLTLAACPVPPGGVDFDVFARATGIGFGNSAAVLVSYTIIEYTTSSFTTASQHEKGIGTLTLGGSSGIANCTLARTTKQSSATSLGSQPATQNILPGTGISIGTAANTLVFISPSVADTIAFPPYVDSTATNATGWANPLITSGAVTGSDADGVFQTSGQDYYIPFIWTTPMLVKRLGLDIRTATGAGTSNAYGRIYQVNSSGQPGKLLYDFGLLGTTNASLNSGNTSIQSGASGNGYFLTPGVYFLNLIASYTGNSQTPTAYGNTANFVMPATISSDASNFTFGRPPMGYATASSGTAGAAPDPANLTSYTVRALSGNRVVGFGLKAS